MTRCNCRSFSGSRPGHALVHLHRHRCRVSVHVDIRHAGLPVLAEVDQAVQEVRTSCVRSPETCVADCCGRTARYKAHGITMLRTRAYNKVAIAWNFLVPALSAWRVPLT